MYKNGKLNSLADYTVSPNDRGAAITYFYRFNTVNPEVSQFLSKYQELSKRDNAVLTHMNRVDMSMAQQIGDGFSLDKNVILKKLKQFVTKLTPNVFTNMTLAIYDKLVMYKNNGKSDSAIKNMFITWTCWLNDLPFLSEMGNKITKILFTDSPTIQELWFLSVLAYSGCDVVLILKNGEQDYLKLDPNSELSTLYECQGTTIDRSFSINSQPTSQPTPQHTAQPVQPVRPQSVQQPSRPFSINPKYTMCTNAWLSSNKITEVDNTNRGTDPNLLYNVFIQYNGIWDRESYVNDLFALYDKLILGYNTLYKALIYYF